MISRINIGKTQLRRFTSAAHSEAYGQLATRQWASAPTDGSAVKNFIGGKFVESRATTFYDVHDPVSLTGMRIALTGNRQHKESFLEHLRLPTRS
jgi:malonate-semialdehyde dehydrogenase (acetylating)/methylmalonate-semialdehyde dehydrogenase